MALLLESPPVITSWSYLYSENIQPGGCAAGLTLRSTTGFKFWMGRLDIPEGPLSFAS
jgi:hypothetical protein